MAQSFSDTIQTENTPSSTDDSGEQKAPIIRLDRALQRISFALENNKRTYRDNPPQTQALVTHLDHLISRVRDTLDEINATGDL